ncbi:Protein of unknown function [Bacillus wiedmannii]|nr:Protein of unknown function [Bacillus wiedmannii]
MAWIVFIVGVAIALMLIS